MQRTVADFRLPLTSSSTVPGDSHSQPLNQLVVQVASFVPSTSRRWISPGPRPSVRMWKVSSCVPSGEKAATRSRQDFHTVARVAEPHQLRAAADVRVLGVDASRSCSMLAEPAALA